MAQITWHTKNIKEVLIQLGVNLDSGLSQEKYEERIKRYGLNIIESQRGFRVLKIIKRQVKSPLVFILIFAGIAALLLGELTDATVIFIAVVINTAIGVFQEGKADKAFNKLRSLVKKRSVSIRDGHEQEVDSSSLVPGDIIIIRAGDKIGADARLIEERGLNVNESILTGEWLPKEKHTDIVDEKTRITEQSNMIWMGTLVTEGWGKAVVVNTGLKTQLGQIAESLQKETTLTPFQKGVKHLAHLIGGIVVAASFIIFFAGILRGEGVSEMFLMAVAISVAAIPEGLPIAATVILAVGMERILKRGGLVRNLTAAETLGSTSIILTDKTGTLTKAEMHMSQIITYQDVFGARKNKDRETELLVLEIGMLASEAFIENPEANINEWIVRGSPTDQALLMAGAKEGLHPDEILKKYKKIDFLPFNSERRFAVSLNKEDKKTRLSVAGAPEKILAMSSFVAISGKTIEMSAKKIEELKKAYEKVSAKGARVIAVAYMSSHLKEIPKESEGGDDQFDKFIFAGFICFSDPIRSDVKESLQMAIEAGLRPIMITGDHRSTALAIAKEAGLKPEKDGPIKVMDGEKFEEISDEDMDRVIEDIDVYARVLPHQKMIIVKAWQKKGEVVAMTGDGVNDAPALKRADIGIALGSGTEVAKEASDLVLLNNSFSVIVSAIEEGRVVMDNLRKSITFLLATGFTEIILIGGALLAGLPLPMLPAQILWANIVGEGFMNFAFAFEPKEEDVMKRDPRESSSKKIITREMAWLIFGIGIITDLFLFALFFSLWSMDYPIERIRTIMFAGLGIAAIFFVYSLKSLRRPIWKLNIFSNPYLIIASMISLLLLIAALTLPPLKNLLSLTDITFTEFMIVFGLGILDLIAIEIAKHFFYSRQKIKESNLNLKTA